MYVALNLLIQIAQYIDYYISEKITHLTFLAK